MDKPEKVLSIYELDNVIIEKIQDVVSTAIARDLTRKVIKEVCGEPDYNIKDQINT